jgi:hypothetical protein
MVIKASITTLTIGAATLEPKALPFGSSTTANTTYLGSSTGKMPTKLVIRAVAE